MRCLKFRQFVNGRFHYWGFLEKDCFIGPINPIDPSQQFTGLFSKSGKEIYEGDVVKSINKGIKVIEWYEDDCQFGVEGTYLYRMANREIIGNIYENPELRET